MAANDFFLTGVNKQPQGNALQPIDDFINGGQGTNAPRPVDITPQVQDIFSPAPIAPQAPSIAGIPDFHKAAMIPQSGPLSQPPAPLAPEQQMSTAGEARPMSPEEQARQAAIGEAIIGQPEAQQRRQMEFDAKMKEAKAGVGARTVIKSLQKEGMTQEDIRQAIGGTEGKSKIQALAELQRLQTTRTKARAEGGIENRVRDRVVDGARFDTDESGNQIPENTEARAKLFLDRGDDLGPDPSSDQSLYDSMKPSERSQYDRTIKSMSQGTRNPNAERRMSDLVDRAEKRREGDYLKKQAAQASKSIKDAQKKADNAEDKQLIDNAKSELLEIGKLLKEKGVSEEDEKKYEERRKGILDWINEFNVGKAAEAKAPTTEQTPAETVQMQAPDGRTLSVPADRVKEMEGKGAKTI